MSFYEGFEKRAVDLKGLRKAWSATVKPSLVRAGYKRSGRFGGDVALSKKKDSLSGFLIPAKKEIAANIKKKWYLPRLIREELLKMYPDNITDKVYLKGQFSMPKYMKNALRVGSRVAYLAEKTLGKTRVGKGFGKIMQESLEKGYPKLDKYKSKAGKASSAKNKEAINRIVGVHEGIEKIVGKKNRKGFKAERFSGHLSPDVLLRESNIVSTLPKELRGAKAYFQNLRAGEGADMKKMFPGFEYGKGRISRHARKRLMERAIEKKRVKTFK